MTDCEKDVTHIRAVRALYLKAAQNLIKENVTETRNPSMSADQVCVLAEYQRKIADIDRELAAKIPTEIVLRKLELENEAVNERERLWKESLPIMRKITQQQKKIALHKKFSKYTERYIKAMEDADSMLQCADEIVSQPSSYSSTNETDRELSDDVVEEIVTGALGRPSTALNKKLVTAIKTNTAVNDVPLEDTKLLPDVPTHLP